MALVSLSLPSSCASSHHLEPSSSNPAAGSRIGLPSASHGVLALTATPGRRGGVQWRAPASLSSFSSFLPSFFKNKEKEDAEKAARLKEELLAAIPNVDDKGMC